MNLDPTISLGNILSLVGMIVAAIYSWVVVRGQAASARQDVDDLQKSHDALARRVEEIRAKGAHELAEWKLYVAREYVTAATIKEVEERMIEAINRLGDRFDRYFDSARPSSPRRRGNSSK